MTQVIHATSLTVKGWEPPAGYEFFDHRSSKLKSAQAWRPCDALYAARELMPRDAKTAVVAWQDGNGDMRYRCAGDPDSVIALLMRVVHDRC